MKFGKGSQVSEYDLHLSNNSITKVSSAKFLGIIIDDELGCSEHINHIEGMEHATYRYSQFSESKRI